MVEGPISARRENMSHHTVEIAENITDRNPQSLESGITQPAIANIVPFGIAPHRMRLAVNLDRESALEAGKVDHVTATWKLSAKPQAVRTLAQLLPQGDLGQGQLAAKLSRKTNVGVRSADGAVADAPRPGPSTMLRMVPLPVPGRIYLPRHPLTVLEQTANEKA